MLRIHFTTADLERIRFAPTIGVAAETCYALETVMSRRPRASHEAHAGPRDRGADTRPLTSLLEAGGIGPDLLALAGDTPFIDHAVDNLLSVSDSRWQAEFRNITFLPRHASWAHAVAAGRLEERQELVAALRACHRLLVAPSWNRARTELVVMSTRHSDLMLGGGVDAFFRELEPKLIRWRRPVLEVSYPREVEVRLQGRGLVITPTLFAGNAVSFLWDPLDITQAPRMTVPAVHGAPTSPDSTGSDDAPANLGALLGRTRAAALRATVEGVSTTELARRLGISVAAASQHTAILRNARLITTRRRGGSVLHLITPLGAALSGGGTPPAPGGRDDPTCRGPRV
ncbi:ArsR/SmtB family transcription factor [Streptomyces sp. AHA2]|uniref:ArsR/SmtB family transcription factor n=1 Tax=Streptomyces sp. AHA2 TaxID=3064526 RepID=UPI002FE250DA